MTFADVACWIGLAVIWGIAAWIWGTIIRDRLADRRARKSMSRSLLAHGKPKLPAPPPPRQKESAA